MNLKDKPFALLGVNVNGYDPATLKEAMDKENMNWRSFADPDPEAVGQGAIATRWNLSATPTFYIIDHEGVIRHKWVGSPDEHEIDVALEKLIPEAEENAK